MAITVSRISSGTSTVSDAGSRVTRMLETRSFVLQDAPKSAVSTCLTKIPSWTQ